MFSALWCHKVAKTIFCMHFEFVRSTTEFRHRCASTNDTFQLNFNTEFWNNCLVCVFRVSDLSVARVFDFEPSTDLLEIEIEGWKIVYLCVCQCVKWFHVFHSWSRHRQLASIGWTFIFSFPFRRDVDLMVFEWTRITRMRRRNK